jgi:PAS domain S-box-containing protein
VTQTADLQRRLAEALQENADLRRDLALAQEKPDLPVLEALEAVSEGFAIFDSEGRLEFYNDFYVENIWPQIADILAPGVQFDTIITEIARRLDWDNFGMAAETFLAMAQANHSKLPSISELNFPDGRWLRMSKRRTASGGVVAVYADITELKQAKIHLELVLGAIDHIAEAVSIYGPDDRLVYFNEAMKNVTPDIAAANRLGITFEERARLISRTIKHKSVDDHDAWIKDRVARHRTPGQITEAVLGGSTWLFQEQRLLDGSTVNIGRDISRYKRSDQALRESEERYALAIAALDEGVWEMKFETGLYYRSPRWLEILGFDEHDLEPGLEKFLALVHPDDLGPMERAYDAHYKSGGPYDIEFRARRKSGEYIWLRSRAQTVRDEDGRPLRIAGTIRNITEIKLANAQRDMAFSAIEQVSEAISIYDPEDSLVYLNQAMKNLYPNKENANRLGIGFEERINILSDSVGLTSKDDIKNFVKQRLSDRDKRNERFETNPSVGSTWLFLDQRLPDGSSVTTARDITRQKNTEQALRESEARYALVLAAKDEGLWEANFVTGIYYRSPRWNEILGYGENELPPTRAAFSALIHPEDSEAAQHAFDSHLELGTPFDIEYRVRHKSGDYIWVSIRGKAVWGADGKPVRLVGSIRDITEQKLAENQLLLIQERTNAQFKNNPVPSFLWQKSDDEFILVDHNEAAATLNHGRVSKMIGQSAREVLESRPDVLISLGQVLADRTVISHTAERPDIFGSQDQWDITTYAFIPPDCVMVCVQDITDIKTLEHQLIQAQKMEAVGQLPGGVAHDFNNLLSAVMTNAQLLELQLGDDNASRLMASQIVQVARRGAELTHRLLAFSRKQALQPESISLNALVNGMRNLLQRSLGETIEIKMIAGNQISNVLADSGQVENALVNLAINASHAMPDGGMLTIAMVNATISNPEWADLWEGQTGDYVALKVTDTGTGIDPETLQHVFEPFFTTKEVGEGSGLGLSMVYGFAQQSGGFTTIESEVGAGTSVTIYLPISPNSRPSKKAIGEVMALRQGLGETILLIEDEEAVRVATRKILSKLGYRVLATNDGVEARRLIAEEQRIDLLLSDLILPGGMNGFEIYHEIHQTRPDMKCLFMSGYSSVPDHQRPDDAELLEKPVDMRLLTTRIREILDA